MQISEKQLAQVNDRIQALLKADSFYGKNAQNTKEKALERLTKILAFIFFALIIVVNIIE